MNLGLVSMPEIEKTNSCSWLEAWDWMPEIFVSSWCARLNRGNSHSSLEMMDRLFTRLSPHICICFWRLAAQLNHSLCACVESDNNCRSSKSITFVYLMGWRPESVGVSHLCYNIVRFTHSYEYIRNHFSWSKSFFCQGINYRNAIYSYKLQIVTKLPQSTKMWERKCYFKQANLRNQVTKTPEMGLNLKIFAKTLMSVYFWASHSLQEFRKRGKSSGPDPPPPPIRRS